MTQLSSLVINGCGKPVAWSGPRFLRGVNIFYTLMIENPYMNSTTDIGKAGEELAVAWLRQRGYTILHCNWRHKNLEIDIIATRGRFLHFVEVKTLRQSRYGNRPEASVTKKKFKHLQQAADEYLYRHPGHRWIQYDVLAITLCADGEAEYFLLEDIYL